MNCGQSFHGLSQSYELEAIEMQGFPVLEPTGRAESCYHTEANQSTLYCLFSISLMSLQGSQVTLQLMAAAATFLPLCKPCNSPHKPCQDGLVTLCKALSECWAVFAFYPHLLVRTELIFKSPVCDVPALTGVFCVFQELCSAQSIRVMLLVQWSQLWFTLL